MAEHEHLLKHLKANLTSESKAYGYTLVIWGSGALLINQYGFPAFQDVMLYVFGALTGFAVLAVITYKGVFIDVANPREDRMIVASMLHYIAALGTVGISRLLHVHDAALAFFIVGVNASVMYNVLLLVEIVFGEHLRGAEEALHEFAGVE